jgi:phosphohistidine phosphatase
MKTLLVQRHAKSCWKDGDLADIERPLNRRGREDAPRMALFLRARGLVPDLILCSTAKRARQTARREVDAGQFTCRVEPDRQIYDADEPQELLAVLRAVPGDLSRIMLIGHNPCLEEFVEALTAEPAALPTAAVAQIELDIAAWSDLEPGCRARLVGVWRPRELPPAPGA